MGKSNRPHVLIMIESARESGREYIKGVADYANHFGPWHFHWKAQGLSSLEEPLKAIPLDGVIARDVARVQSVVKSGTPTIMMRYTQDGNAGTIFVETDDHAISMEVTTHFQQRGFRHFAFCGIRDLAWSTKREEAFASILKESGYRVDCYRAAKAMDIEDIEFQEADAIKHWLESLPKPVALMAANDDIGRFLVQLCQDASLRVPEECSIVGVDNDPVVCGLSNPPLSSVEVRFRQAGYRAAAALDKLMQGQQPELRTILSDAGDLVVRQSSDIIAVDDPAVAKALRFIREMAARPTNVNEITRASGISRRVLEKRFRQHMSKTVLQHHREVRADHIARILDETKLSQEEIAYQCGFPEPSHLTRFFNSMRGQSPSAFRNRRT